LGSIPNRQFLSQTYESAVSAVDLILSCKIFEISVRFPLYAVDIPDSMGALRSAQAYSRPSIDWFAGRINDPVLRLRFLRAVAPPEPVPPPKRRFRRHLVLLPLLMALAISSLLLRATARPDPPARPTPRGDRTTVIETTRTVDVWLVEKNGNSETYSNGLRIDNRFVVLNHPRSYRAFALADPGKGHGVRQSSPAGIVFHTTESRQAPFEATQVGVLKSIGESLLEYVRRKRAYNFLIDRFGRVYRIVAESDAANHAGYSVWSDQKWLYLNLNESFLGVSFEAQTQPGQVEAQVGPAQVRAAAMLTEMLRGRFGIAAANCVTHAQVSVNPSNMRVGYHTDWASSFPFEQLGLPNNYERPLPALWAYGFESDPTFLRWAGARLAVGVRSAEERVSQGAAEAGLSLRDYRRGLQKRFREQLAEGRHPGSTGEDESE
jgi:N-acetylmuramoyl-L-alanine amidase-like protein